MIYHARMTSFIYCSLSLQRSGTYSDVSSVGELLPLVTTTPDEQSQVFMVMGQDVSKSVVSKGLIYNTSYLCKKLVI